jgi:cellobiose phosphorylase
LFDCSPRYRGGPQRYFQRAESSAFFGREIGTMYMHAHLRYAEAMANFGDAEAFFRALCQTNPITIRTLVPSAALRQANCYYSSSDAAFPDRYEARAHYDRIKDGTVRLEGGWRIYSSGPGIALRLIIQNFLGIAREPSAWRFDPVIPPALNGLQAAVMLAGKPVGMTYRIGSVGYGPVALTLNGEALSFTREANPFRTGGVSVSTEQVLKRLTSGTNSLIVQLE